MAATLHDVARLAGVSIKTVSNVINDYPHIRPATRARVEQAIAELGYQPNLSARSLRSGRTGAIALAVPELGLSYFAELADCRHRAAEAGGRGRARSSRPAATATASSSCCQSAAQDDRRPDLQPARHGAGRRRPARGAVSAGAARRAHLRRPGRPRDDAERRGGAGGHRVPHRAGPTAHRGRSAPTRAR